MIGLLYMLLRTDAELLATIPPDTELPDPKLYDPEIHKAHVAGGYVPAKKRPTPASCACPRVRRTRHESWGLRSLTPRCVLRCYT
jgi:hypothetical protein